MASTLTDTIALTQEQRVVVDAPLDARLLVLAGAGTGKTEVLVERIRRLVHDEQLAPGREVLVLSFSRAAVGEVRRRIGLGADRSRLVRPITFDSFATHLLASLPQNATPAGWRDRSYDGRIDAATRTLATDEGRSAVAEYRHVFVDEIQDLVDVRASLVVALLAAVQGFTLLGDPAQAIYDHQIRGHDDLSSDAFLDLVRRIPDLRTLTLSNNHRTAFAALDDVGERLRSSDPDPALVADELDEIRRTLEPLARFDDLPAALYGTRRPTAVLCRTNIDALRVSQELSSATVRHRLQGEATDTVIPPWLARLFTQTERTSWSRRRLEELAADRLAETGPAPDTVWRLLSDSVGDDDTIDLERLRRRISFRMASDELTAPPDAAIVVSTVHRAKGLEFDLVFTDLAASDSAKDERRLEELRIVYVAFSRARDEVWRFPHPPAEPWGKDPTIEHRRVRTAWRQEWRTTALEIRADDLASARPFGAGIVDADPVDTQAYLAQGVETGDRLELRLHHVRESEEPIPFYTAFHEDRPIAETTEAFGRTLARRLRPYRGRWPRALAGLYCQGLETVAGTAGEGKAAGLGTSGLWLRPRVIGLGELLWEEE